MDFVNFIISNGRGTGSLADNVNGLVKSQLDRASAESATEYNANNAWNVNFTDGNVNNNNNKYNSNRVRPVVALDDEIKEGWVIAKNDCCTRKKSSCQCNNWRTDYEFDLWLLVSQVYSRTYTPSTSTCFIVTRPKLREIFAAAFRDRVVQHWVCLRLEPLFEKRFVEQGNVSFNCRKGLGTIKAVEALRNDIVERSENYSKEAWVGRFDLTAFFMSIDRKILWKLLEPFIKENYKGNDIDTLLYLTKIIVYHSPQFDCKRNSPREMWEGLAANKSLFCTPEEIGMAIGNLTSQLFANFYLSFFDGFMNWLCARYNCKYRRFVDDFTVVGDKRIILKIIRPLAEAYLRKRLHVRLHRDKFYIQPVRHGIKFVGSVIMPGRTYISNRTVCGFYNGLRKAEATCNRIEREGASARTLGSLRHCVAALNSYLGFLIHCSSFKLRKKLLLELPESFWNYCYVTEGLKCVKIKLEYQLPYYLRRKEAEQYGISL